MRYDVERVLARLGVEVEKQSGGRLWARCPLGEHEEKDPSWMVWNSKSPKAGKWYCFGRCHEGGDLVDLVVRVRKLGKSDHDFGADDREPREVASEWLRSEEIAEPAPRAVVLVSSPTRTRAFALPAGVKFAPLPEWPTPLRAYAERRRMTAEQVERFGIGYAVDGRLSMRVVFVARDQRGEVVSYAARSILPDALRYLTPKDEEGADKAAIFAPLWGTRPAPLTRRVWVAEGAFNALAIERAVDESVVALLGSRIHARHVLRLASHEEVVIVTDPDPAGERALAKLRGALSRHVTVRCVTLPEGRDADEVEEAEGVEGLRRLLWSGERRS